MSEIHFNYILSKISELANSDSIYCLDFGCSQGGLVKKIIDKNIKAVGVDILERNNDTYEEKLSKKNLTLNKDIFLYDGRNGEKLPFEDSTFDIVISNMVFEHIQYPKPCLFEIHRVLKPRGKLLALFPTAECFYEGHALLYGVHKLNKYEKIQYLYMHLMDEIGLGKNKGRSKNKENLRGVQRYIRSKCFYHSSKEINQMWKDIFSNSPVNDELGYFIFRLQRHPKFRIFKNLSNFVVFQKLFVYFTIFRLTRVYIGEKIS